MEIHGLSNNVSGEKYSYRYKNMSKYSMKKIHIMHDEFKRTDKSWDVTMGREKLQAIPATGTLHNGLKFCSELGFLFQYIKSSQILSHFFSKGNFTYANAKI